MPAAVLTVVTLACLELGRRAWLSSRIERPIPMLGVSLDFDTDRMLVRLIKAIDYPVDRVVVVYSGDPTVRIEIAELKSEGYVFDVREESRPMGAAGGYNRVMEEAKGRPWVMVVNNDVTFPPGMLREAARLTWEAYESDPKLAILFFAYQFPGSGYPAFTLTAHGIETVGIFDENIHPFLFPDSDYAIRLHILLLQGVVTREFLGEKGVRFHHGYLQDKMYKGNSGTIAKKSQTPLGLDLKQKLARAYNLGYMNQKWNFEGTWFTVPFNKSMDLWVPPIDWQRRHCIETGEGVDEQGHCPYTLA